MSDLDKFVLQYTVELKDSIARLEKLNQKVDAVKTTSGKVKDEVKTFAKGAADELGKLIPGVAAVNDAVMSMGKSFGIAAVAVTALGLGVGALIKTRNQYNQQRLTGQETGVSGMRIEEYQRKFQNNGAGYTTREMTTNAVKSIANKVSAAYTDPTRMGPEARLFNLLGIDVGARGTGVRGTNQIMTDLGRKFAGSTDAQARAWGAQLGLSPDISSALRRAGASIGSVTALSKDEVDKRAAAQNNLDQFNEATAKLSEQFTRLTNKIAQDLLPAVTKIVSWITRDAPKTTPEERQHRARMANPGQAMARLQAERYANDPRYRDADDEKRAEEKKKQDAKLKKEADEKAKEEKLTAAKNEKSAEKTVDAADAAAKNGRTAQDEFQLAINMFSGAVASFTNAVDERQAMAAWAGEIGKAAGLAGPAGPGGAKGKDNFNAMLSVNTQYDAIFSAAEKKYGLPAGILKRIAGVESAFRPDAVSAAGAQGLMQLMPANSAAMKIKNPLDPASNIFGGAELFADYLKRSGGNIRTALMMYHGGLDQNGWGPLTTSYPDKVLGMGRVSAAGESKANIRLNQTYENISRGLGLPNSTQLKLGGINRGDVTWEANQLEAGIQNKIFDLRKQYQTVNLPVAEYQRIQRDIIDQTMALNTLRENRGIVEAKAQPGPRTAITINSIPITVHFGGTPNPNQNDTLDRIRQGTLQGIQDALNQYTTGNKL